MQKIYVFGYGSLMNPYSLARTLPAKRHAHTATLSGYRRKMNAPVGDYLYMNIVESDDAQIEGVLIEVSKKELAKLEKREVGYDQFDVTDRLSIPIDGRVFAFIAPDRHFHDKKILRSYLHTCLLGVPHHRRDQWLQETEIYNPIHEDLDHPAYNNASTI